MLRTKHKRERTWTLENSMHLEPYKKQWYQIKLVVNIAVHKRCALHYQAMQIAMKMNTGSRERDYGKTPLRYHVTDYRRE